jgi:hypothetical protein
VVLERLEGLPETSANLTSEPLVILVNVSHLLNHVRVCCIQVAHPAEPLDGLLTSILGEQPSGRLGEPDGANQEHAGRNQLNREWDEPLRVAWFHGVVDTVVDPCLGLVGSFCRGRPGKCLPKADEATNLPAQLVDPDETPSNGGRGQLRDEDGSHVAAATDTEACEDASSENEV